MQYIYNNKSEKNLVYLLKKATKHFTISLFHFLLFLYPSHPLDQSYNNSHFISIIKSNDSLFYKIKKMDLK